MGNASATVDRSQHPIVVFRVAGAPTLDMFEVALHDFDEVLRTGERYVLVIDASHLDTIASSVRLRSARWLIDNGPAVMRQGIGVYAVVTSPLARAAILAMEWLDPRGIKYEMVDTFDEAVLRAKSCLASHRPEKP